MSNFIWYIVTAFTISCYITFLYYRYDPLKEADNSLLSSLTIASIFLFNVFWPFIAVIGVIVGFVVLTVKIIKYFALKVPVEKEDNKKKEVGVYR